MAVRNRHRSNDGRRRHGHRDRAVDRDVDPALVRSTRNLSIFADSPHDDVVGVHWIRHGVLDHCIMSILTEPDHDSFRSKLGPFDVQHGIEGPRPLTPSKDGEVILQWSRLNPVCEKFSIFDADIFLRGVIPFGATSAAAQETGTYEKHSKGVFHG